jgi:hypothetical protein
VGEGTEVLDPVHLRMNGIGLEGTDPNKKSSFLKGVGEDNNGLLASRINDESVDLCLNEIIFLRSEVFSQRFTTGPEPRGQPKSGDD